MSVAGWETLPGSFPWPPQNLQVFSAFRVGYVDLRWDDPSTIAVGGGSIAPTRAAGTITVTGVPDTLEQATGTLTVVSAPVPVGATVTVGGVVLTSVAGPPVPGDDTFDGSGPAASDVAASIAAAIGDGSVAGWGVATASAASDTVTLVAVPEGTAGNGVTLSTDTPLVTPSGATLDGGADAATLSIGLITLSATTGPRTTGTFTVGPTNFDTAASISDAIGDPTNHLVGTVVASVSADIVQVVAAVVGTDGNTIALATDSEALTLSGPYLSDGSGAYCPPVNNTAWTIVGVNIYRSDNGQRGPYVRVNRVPIGSLAYRDHVDNTLIEEEVVRWDGDWLSKATDPNNADWIFRAKFTPVVKPYGQAVAANAPTDVTLKIDGVVVPVQSVFGPTGDVTLINQPTWDLARERWVPPVLPSEYSAVTVTYRYNANLIQTDLDRTNQVFYRLTTVALDPTGTSPSGLVETPLGYCPPVGLAEVETVDWIWREAKRRNLYILEQGGERVKLFKRKVSGLPCPCYIDPATREYGQQPSARCGNCFGTGYVGGYDGPTDIIVAPDDAERRVSQTPNGRRLEHGYEVWTTENPSITQRDFIVKQTGERYSIGAVRRPAVRGLPLQQHFNIQYLDEQDIRYRVPVTGTDDLPWPETRYTNPELSACVEADPYPVGFDYQASPMGTEVPKIPDGREIRGRTPVWANTTYGGKGGGA
ncbi:MAG: hypothetical protein EBT79_10510 [Actinobacteria bacterium]|nr:hypothetical protein [Actinomycetota bacterium]NBR67684.1 hypothetical protein [Actinomycetota bacterium]